ILAVFAGSIYDGLSEGYNYGTARGSYYAKAHTGTNNWGHTQPENTGLIC
ncbi:Pkp1: Plakophilin-1, partial [Crotalus adamanteus]